MSRELLYTNYEEAQNRMDSNDRFVVRLLSAIHRAMLENANIRQSPSYPFDMKYYYDALVRVIGSTYDYEPQVFRCDDSAISAANPPDFTESEFRNSHFAQSGLAAKFVQLVQSESQDSGVPFDLNFACQIAAVGLSESAIEYARQAIGTKSKPAEDDFEDWLGGFFASNES